jgi:hypothetical protein
MKWNYWWNLGTSGFLAHQKKSGMSEEKYQLPPLPDDIPWSSNFIKAHGIVASRVIHARDVLYQDSGNPVQLRILLDSLVDETIPILDEMSKEKPRVMDWMVVAVDKVAQLVVDLRNSATTIGNE